jgi:2-phospho-L-lactate guanylyltransferase
MVTHASVWAIVPVKPFLEAKARLAPVLDENERARLARLMLEDVLAALCASRHLLAGVLVPTADGLAAEIARRMGAVPIAEESAFGLNPAIERAVSALKTRPDDGVIVVPADLPQLSVATVERIVDTIDTPAAVALVPALADGGTNLLASRPIGVIPPLFGLQSFWRHGEAARHAGARTTIVRGTELEQDIDRPEDLVAFLSMGTATRTHTFLCGLEIGRRLARSVQPLNRGMTSRAIVSI